MSKRAAGNVREDLLHHGVVTVLPLGLDHGERRVGEHRVVAPGGKQLALASGALLVQVPDPPDDQPRGDRLAFPARERRVRDLGDLGVGDPGAQLVVPDHARGADRGPGVLRNSGDRGPDAGFTGTVTENQRRRCDRPDHLAVVRRRVQPDDDRPGAAALPGGGDGAGGQAGSAAGGGGVAAAAAGWRRSPAPRSAC